MLIHTIVNEYYYSLRLIEPHFYDGNVNTERYVQMLRTFIIDKLKGERKAKLI